VQEKIEMKIESATELMATKRANWLPFQKLFINTIEIPVNQKKVKSAQTRLNVTKWRYLSTTGQEVYPHLWRLIRED